MTAETVEIKKEIRINFCQNVMDGSAKKVMDASAAAMAAKRRNERK